MNLPTLKPKFGGAVSPSPISAQDGVSRNTLDLAQARASSTADPLAVAAELRAVHEAKIQIAWAQLSDAVTQANGLMSAFDPENDSAAELTAALDTIATDAGLSLHELIAQIRLANDDLEHFRLRHGLSHQPEERSTLIGMLILALMIFIEGGINSFFFMSAHMVAGPFAALLTSVLISFANVFVSALAGFHFGRFKDYGARAPDHNVVEFVATRRKAHQGFLAYLLVMAGFHLTVGLIRSGEVLERVDHSLLAYWELLTTPEAIFLVMTGIGFSALAYHKGKHLDEPYPEYGALHRQVLAKRDALLDLHESTIEQIHDAHEEAIEQIDRQVKARRSAIEHYNEAVKACVRAKAQLDQVVAQAKTALQKQLSQVTSTFAAKRGRKPKAAEAAAELQSFEAGPAIDLPTTRPMPNGAAQKAAVAQARAAALARVNALFQGALASDSHDFPGDVQ